MDKKIGDVQVTDAGGHVALVEIQRGPNNFFDEDLIRDLADVFLALDDDSDVRAAVLASQGKHFCAGANFGSSADRERRSTRTADAGNPLYQEAVRLFRNKKYVVAAVQGAAVGGGFGLSMFPDFRVGCAESRFTANFVKLGFTPGFGLTRVLPRIVGQQAANDLFATGRRIDGHEALKLGILDRLVPQAEVRHDLADIVQAATDHEGVEQFHLQQTADYREGVKAVAERRPGNFQGK